MTDPSWENRFGILGYGTYNNSDLNLNAKGQILLTASLKEPFFGNDPAGECFKSIISVIVLPGANEGRVTD